MTLQVHVSQKAERDVEIILFWLADRSPQGARRWLDKYLHTLQVLPSRAVNSPQAPEATSLGRDLRQLLFKTRKGHTYRTLFVIEGNVIQVLAVRGTGQNMVNARELGFDE